MKPTLKTTIYTVKTTVDERGLLYATKVIITDPETGIDCELTPENAIIRQLSLFSEFLHGAMRKLPKGAITAFCDDHDISRSTWYRFSRNIIDIKISTMMKILYGIFPKIDRFPLKFL